MTLNPVKDPDIVSPPAIGGTKVNPQSCEDEPIRIPGSIQRHGFLLLLDKEDQHVVGASENTEDFLEIPLGLVLGSPVETILEREVLSALKAHTNSAFAENPGLQAYLGSFQVRGRFYSVVTHRVRSERILEFERQDRLVSSEMTNQVFTNFVNTLGSLRNETELCQALTQQVKQLTGFNRILLYRFDEQGHGTVLCEESDGNLPSYLGLRFPASDIPRQARELYVLNTIRIIPDAMYVPSLLRRIGSGSATALDLSMSILRSVSPVHLQYMRNMGTMSSMSLSIVCEGRLWGLISAHHAEPFTVPYLIRTACDLLTRLVSTQLMSLRTSENLKQMVHFHEVQRRILTQMAAENDYTAAMANQMSDIVQITDAAGAALLIDGQQVVFGQTPGDEDLSRLAEWMGCKPDVDIFESSDLSQHLEWADGIAAVASGVLAIRISHIPQSYIMWFRPEVVRTVKWAGEPGEVKDQGNGLNPRRSFEMWKELVRGTSDPWTEMEVESATHFRDAVMKISLKRAEEAIHLGEARFLQLTNALPHPVWTANDDGQITFVNRKWLDQGLDAQGRWYEQERIVIEDRNRCAIAWKISVAEGTNVDLEIRLRPLSEVGDRWNLVRVIPYLHPNGSRAGWVGTCTDFTERRQNDAALRMTEKLALTGRMTSVIAHEINNPLEAITNLLYLLSGHVRQDEVACGYIDLAESELQRISGAAKQTLRWSKERIQKSECGTVEALFKDVLQSLAGKIKNRQVNVVIEGGKDVPFYGAVGHLEQVMSNIVSNAIQAVAVGGRIWLGAKTDGDMTEIVVRDDGHGMSEEILRNLFQPFYTTKGDLGNGLGLYISKEIVERHGGHLKVTSQVGRGTEVRVRVSARKPLTPAVP